METLYNGFILQLSAGSFPLSTDSMVLAHFANCKAGARVLDLGAGCGTLGLMLCAKYDTCQVTGVEIDVNAHRQALCNAETNGIAHRLTSICANISDIRSVVSPGSFSVCVSNPPYFAAGPKSEKLPNARREDLCSLDALFTAADWGLKYGGDFYLVHRPERLAEIFAKASAKGLEPKTLLLLRHQAQSPVSLVLVHCKKGGKPGLIWQEEFLHKPDGQPSDFYRTVYHL